VGVYHLYTACVEVCFGRGELDGDIEGFWCNAATRAACELATALGGSKFGGVVFDSLSKPTKQWVREHEELDRKRKQK